MKILGSSARPSARRAGAARRFRSSALSNAVLFSAAASAYAPAHASTLSWDGDGQLPVNGGSGVWDDTSLRWRSGSSFVAWNDAANDDAIFDPDPGSVLLSSSRSAMSLNFSSNYTLLNPASGAVGITLVGGTIGTGSAQVQILNSLSGTAGLSKTGSGVLVLHGSTSELGGSWSLAAGTTGFGSAIASIPDASPVNIAAGATLNMGIFGGASSDVFGILTGAGNIVLQQQIGLGELTGSMITTGGDNLSGTWSGVISGEGGRFTKAGSGSFTITTAQTYTGITQINGGVNAINAGALVLDAGGALAPQSGVFFGTASLNAATLLLNGNKTLGSLSNGGSFSIVNMQSSSLTIGADNRSTLFNGVVSGSGRLIKSGSGQQAFASNSSLWSGGLTITGGTFVAQLDGRLGAIPGSPDPTNITLNGGALANFSGTSLSLNINRGISVTTNNGGIFVPDTSTTLTVPGSVTGLGRITKTGAGVLALNNATNSFSGGMTITDGAVSSSASSGSPLGTGPITLGGGNLVLTPPASGSNVVLTFGNLDYGPGAAMRLTRDNSIAANFGAINRQAGGTLVIDPVNSIDELGSAAANFVRVTGTGVTNNVNGGVPATNGDIASPSIIAKTSSGNPTGEFVRYGVNGFEKGTYSTSVNINTATVNDVFNATANQAIVTSASVFALNVRSGVTVSGGALNVGDGAHPATVILNGGSITASSLNFDTRQGILYSGGATTVTTGTISSNISGSGGVIKIGEANLRLNTASTFTGGLTIASGTFTTGASNVLPSTADVSLIGRGIVNTTTSPRLSLIGTSQTIASLGGNPGSTVDLGSGGTLIVSGSGDSQYRGAITGSTGSTLIKQGSGVLTLGETLSTSAIPSTTNGYQRLTMRNGGIVQVSSASSLPPALNPGMFPVLADTLRFDGGTLRISSINYSAINSGSTFVLASGTAQRGVTLAAGGGTIDVADPLETVLLQLDDLTARNIISGTGSLSKSGPGTLRLGPGNTFTGKTVVREGRLQFPADSALGAAPTMYVDDALQIHDGAMIQPTGAVVLNANRGITLVGGIGPLGPGEPAVINTSNGGCVVNSSITGSGALKKTGTSNSLVLNSLNDFSGDFVLEAGRVELNASGAAGSGSLVARPAFAVTLTTTAAADTSLFNDVQLDAGSTIEFDIPSSAGKLELLGNISGPNAFSKTGSGTMRLESQGSTFTGQTYVLAGTLLVSGPTGLGSSAGGTLVAPGAVLAFEGNVTHASAEPTYISGTGSGAGAIVNVSGDNVYGGNVTLNLDSTIGVTAGSLKIGRVSGGSILTKIGTGALTAEQFRTTGLTVSTTTVKIAQKAMIGDPADTSIVNNLAIAGGVTPTATLDITNNAVVVDYSTADAEPFDTIRAQIINAYNANAWNLPGITSTLAGGQFGIGYAEASALAAIPPVFGTVDSSAVLVRYTRYGDASLDGSVTLGDFNRLAANFGSSNTVWSQGDFNYDALVNLQDFNRLAANFGLSAGPDGPTPQDWATLASAVPEPSSAILLGLSAGPLMSRAARRRSQRRPQTR